MRPDCLTDEDEEAADDDSLGESFQVATYPPWLHFRNILNINMKNEFKRENLFIFRFKFVL
jgi:hypothetical protein